MYDGTWRYPTGYQYLSHTIKHLYILYFFLVIEKNKCGITANPGQGVRTYTYIYKKNHISLDLTAFFFPNSLAMGVWLPFELSVLLCREIHFFVHNRGIYRIPSHSRACFCIRNRGNGACTKIPLRCVFADIGCVVFLRGRFGPFRI